MANVFNSVKGLHPKRNAFSSHTYRNDFTGKLGVNIPVYQQHVTAATRVKLGTSALIRLQALFAPVMDNIDFYVHYWQIPYRLLEGDRFTAFISGEIENQDYQGFFSEPFAFAEELWSLMNSGAYPENDSDNSKLLDCYNSIFGNGGIFDFLGYDTLLFPKLVYSEQDDVFRLSGGNENTTFNYRPLIAYYLLHLHWYMNENVPYFEQFSEDVDAVLKDPTDWDKLYDLLIRSYVFFGSSLLPHGWEKDYFTSALPNVQYGDPVTIGVGGSAPLVTPAGAVIFDVVSGNTTNTGAEGALIALGGTQAPEYDTQALKLVKLSKANFVNGFTDEPSENTPSYAQAVNGGAFFYNGNTLADADLQVHADTNSLNGIYADLSNASAVTINELRFANALQVFKERQQRFGRRRLEYYKGFFDVTPEDLRLQVPKYLGGGRIPINIADIEQTSSSTETQALGRLAGKGTAVAGGFAGFSTFCSEESVIIGIGFAMPHVTYANSVSKFLMKTNDKYDYFNPSFEHLGEQAIKNIEVFSGAEDPDGDFGYTPRFTEYRFHSNEMHGQFKSSLSYWSLGRIFDTQPALNADFIYMQPKVFDRIFAVEGQDNLIASMIFNVRLIQPVSKYGTPRIMI